MGFNGIIAASRRKSGGDTTAPTVPTGLSSSNMCQTTFTLSWIASTDDVAVTGYEIYKGGVFYADSSGTGTSYTPTGLTAGTFNFWTVKAYDAAYNLSAASSSKKIFQANAVVIYTMTGLGESSSSLACSATVGVTRYKTGTSTAVNNDIIYTDLCAQTPFNGSNNWHSDGTTSYQVSLSGVISNATAC